MDDDELCGMPGPGGTECSLPSGHPGKEHTFEIELPTHVAQVIANYIDHLEESQRDYDRQLRRMRRIRWFLYVATGLNVGAALYYLVQILNES